MKKAMDLHDAVYYVLLTQIQFGVYQYGDNFPFLEDTSKQFQVSVDTVRAAYHRLKQEGYISQSKMVGAKVIVKYNEHQTQQKSKGF